MIQTFNLEQINRIAKEIIILANKSKQSDKATVITLSGDLGAGKTTLTQAIARELGIVENLQSPTFVILKSYKFQATSLKNLIHIDAYRLKSGEELQKLNWDEYVSNKDNLIIIEWPEQVASIISYDVIQIKLSHISETERKIEF